jgi:hypothetical protein
MFNVYTLDPRCTIFCARPKVLQTAADFETPACKFFLFISADDAREKELLPAGASKSTAQTESFDQGP